MRILNSIISKEECDKLINTCQQKYVEYCSKFVENAYPFRKEINITPWIPIAGLESLFVTILKNFPSVDFDMSEGTGIMFSNAHQGEKIPLHFDHPVSLVFDPQNPHDLTKTRKWKATAVLMLSESGIIMSAKDMVSESTNSNLSAGDIALIEDDTLYGFPVNSSSTPIFALHFVMCSDITK